MANPRTIAFLLGLTLAVGSAFAYSHRVDYTVGIAFAYVFAYTLGRALTLAEFEPDYDTFSNR